MKKSTLMKLFLTWGGVFMLLLSAPSCSDDFDDYELQKKIADLTERIQKLEEQAKTTNADLKTLQSLVETLQGNLFIAKVEQTANGYIIHFTNGDKAEIANGEPGTDAPVIGVKADTDGIYYWTITSGGTTEWLTDAEGGKLRAGAVTPQLGIDSEGYWTISYDGGKTSTRILDAAGEPVIAMSSIFSKIEQDGDNLVVTLADGSTITLPIRSNFYLLIKDAPKLAVFNCGETKTFAVESAGVERIALTKPDEWKVALENNTLTITAPTEEHATCADHAGEVSIIYSSASYLSTSVSLKVVLGVIPAGAKNLSADGTANCYIAEPGNTVVFDAQFKGNSTTEAIGEIASAKLVWQDTKDLVQGLYYVGSDKKIVVITGQGISGNAVVAACNAAGDILWSWHLWIADYDPAASLFTTPANASGTTWTFMDRNIGALNKTPGSIDCYGMLYQWGRKDPFTSAKSFTEQNEDYSYKVDAERTVYTIDNQELPSTRTLAAPHGTIEKSIRNPHIFYIMVQKSTGEVDDYGNEILEDDYRTRDWVDVSNDDYWGGVSGGKTIYDPCPAGYKVPTCDAAGNTPYAWMVHANMTWDEINKGATQDGQWFPTLGVRVFTAGGHTYPEGTPYAGMWIGTAGKASADLEQFPNLYGQYMFIQKNKRMYKVTKDFRAQGMSVRCVKE